LSGSSPPLPRRGDGEAGEFCDKQVKLLSLLEIVAQEFNLINGDTGTSVRAVFPTLVFEVRAVSDDALSVWGGTFAVFFLEGSALDGSEFGKLGKDVFAVGVGGGWFRHEFTTTRKLDMVYPK
jgi:hypothetical protein